MKVNPLYYIPAEAHGLYFGGKGTRKKYQKIGIQLMSMPFPVGDCKAERIRRKYQRMMKFAFAFAYIAFASAVGLNIAGTISSAPDNVMWIMFGMIMASAACVIVLAFFIVHLQKKIVRHFLASFRPFCGENDDADALRMYGSALLETERNGYIFAGDNDDDDEPVCENWLCLCCGEKFQVTAVRDFSTSGAALCPHCHEPGLTMFIPALDFDTKAIEYARFAMGESDNKPE